MTALTLAISMLLAMGASGNLDAASLGEYYLAEPSGHVFSRNAVYTAASSVCEKVRGFCCESLCVKMKLLPKVAALK